MVFSFTEWCFLDFQARENSKQKTWFDFNNNNFVGTYFVGKNVTQNVNKDEKREYIKVIRCP